MINLSIKDALVLKQNMAIPDFCLLVSEVRFTMCINPFSVEWEILVYLK